VALVPSKVPVRLGKLDTKTDDRWGIPGNLTASQNLIFDNWPKLRKRNGYAQITKAAAGAMLASYKSQLLLGSGAEAFSYATSGLVDKGVLESLTVGARAVRRDAYAESVPDSAVHPLGITVYTWESSVGGAQYSVFDTATGQPIVSGVSLGRHRSSRRRSRSGNTWWSSSTIRIRTTCASWRSLRRPDDTDRGRGLRDRSGDHPDLRLHGHRRHQRRSVRRPTRTTPAARTRSPEVPHSAARAERDDGARSRRRSFSVCTRSSGIPPVKTSGSRTTPGPR
jgi:hypothetical protein